jgi:ubiquinol-cytochrome c reductase cytochrome c subunit
VRRLLAHPGMWSRGPDSSRRAQALLVLARLLVLALVIATTAVGAAPAAAGAASPAPPLQTTPADVESPAGSGSFTPAPTPEPVPSSTYAPGTAGRLYAENCAGCHGARGEGYVGPPLAPAGFASLVVPMVAQGGISMPPFGGVLSEDDIDAVSEFVAEELADPESRTAEVAPGGDLYRLYCAGCHSAIGSGGAMPKGNNAPNIRKYPAAEALAAMILGRGNMPAFAGNTFAVRQQTAVALYVQVLAPDPPSPGGAGLGFLGPVPEGAAGAVALFLLILVAVWLAWRSRKAVP